MGATEHAVPVVVNWVRLPILLDLVRGCDTGVNLVKELQTVGIVAPIGGAGAEGAVVGITGGAIRGGAVVRGTGRGKRPLNLDITEFRARGVRVEVGERLDGRLATHRYADVAAGDVVVGDFINRLKAHIAGLVGDRGRAKLGAGGVNDELKVAENGIAPAIAASGPARGPSAAREFGQGAGSGGGRGV